MHSVRAYKMIFAVLERRLIQLLIKWSQFLSIIFAVLLIILLTNFTNNNLIIILLFAVLNLVTIYQNGGRVIAILSFHNGGRPPSWILL